MEMLDIIINTVAAFFTSILSAIIGMGGGITLLAVMILSMELSIVIPIHGLVQFASNSSRWILFWKHIDWFIITRYTVGLVPFSFLGIHLVGMTHPTYLKIFIGFFILFAVYFPFHKLNLSMNPKRSFIYAGILNGTVSMIAGATGPLLAPFFLNRSLTKETLIASKAACQALAHFIKIILFGTVLGFDYTQYWSLILFMVVAVVIGTYMGKRILTRYISERIFITIYKSVLTLVGLKILFYDGLGNLLFFHSPPL